MPGVRLAVLLGLAATAGVVAFVPRAAHACGVSGDGPVTALPRPGATGVPTALDVIVLEPPPDAPLSLAGGGETIPLDRVELLGRGHDATSGATGEVACPIPLLPNTFNLWFPRY